MPKSKLIEFPFYQYMWSYYTENKREIRKSYTNLTKQILANADYDKKNPNRFLRRPQYEAFEMYVFLKEYLNTPRLADLFDDWKNNRGKFTFDSSRTYKEGTLFTAAELTNKETLSDFYKQLSDLKQDYANYIFSLTMGTGKTILMATCIFYEFLLAHKFPKDERFCHNALVLAPDTTVLQSLKEIQTFDKAKVFGERYASELDTILKFHFLDEVGAALNTMDGSDFNLIISTNQKIILRRRHTDDSAAESLFKNDWNEILKNNPNADLYQIDNDSELTQNQRYRKLTRLGQLGIYVDEAHHAFGKTLKNDMLDRSRETSLRLTIDNLVKELDTAGTKVVACFNFTGTPYVDNVLMPEVVYEYGLKSAIDAAYLKKTVVEDYSNVKCQAFVTSAVKEFVAAHRGKNGIWKRYEGMLPKMAFFAEKINELEKELKPALENALREFDVPEDEILVNVGDPKQTSADDIREFLRLDTQESKKQFILLVGKGKEGWNCRSLFSVALFRKPKSTIFVLQATMRCLRSITNEQQTGQIFLSSENFSILQDELNKNFKVSVDDLKGNEEKGRKQRHIYVEKKVPVEVVEENYEFKISERKPESYSLFDEESGFDFEKYRRTKGTHSLRNIETASVRQEVQGEEERQFTEYSLVAELSLFLTEHEEKDGKLSVKFPPSEIQSLLQKCSDGMDAILEKVNYSNDILYDWIVPSLFKEMYKITYEQNGTKTVTKWLSKEPDSTDASGKKCFNLAFDDDLFIEESEPDFAKFSQKSDDKNFGKKSFNLSGYGFDSSSELDFFKLNLFDNNEIAHIWFTGMLTNGQSDFFVHYVDPETHTLRAYYPDFLVQMKNGEYYIVEIKGENLIEKQSTQAKADYARQMYKASRMEYVFIPSRYAKMILQDFIKQSTNAGQTLFSAADKTVRFPDLQDSYAGLQKVADSGKAGQIADGKADKDATFRIRH